MNEKEVEKSVRTYLEKKGWTLTARTDFSSYGDAYGQ